MPSGVLLSDVALFYGSLLLSLAAVLLFLWLMRRPDDSDHSRKPSGGSRSGPHDAIN